MAPLARSPILSALARTKIQRAGAMQFRQYATAKAAKQPANMSGPTKRTVGTLMMYVPVCAVVMFWPYAIPNIMGYSGPTI